MSKQRSTESSEDYLEAILRIRSERGSCRNVDIACLLGYSKASVTKALAGLSAGLAEVVARDVRLTPEGERIARRTLGRHRFFEGLLLEAGVDGKTTSREACRMEHCLSEGSFEKLAALLGEGAAGRT